MKLRPPSALRPGLSRFLVSTKGDSPHFRADAPSRRCPKNRTVPFARRSPSRPSRGRTRRRETARRRNTPAAAHQQPPVAIEVVAHDGEGDNEQAEGPIRPAGPAADCQPARLHSAATKKSVVTHCGSISRAGVHLEGGLNEGEAAELDLIPRDGGGRPGAMF